MDNELSRPVAIGRLTEEEVHPFVATPDERTGLARRFGLRAIDALAAEVRLVPLGRSIRLDATLEAEVVQECVVTLQPVPSRLREHFTLLYGEGSTDPDDDAVVEPLSGETIDIGEAVAQQLSLALDPYPRAPGAALDRRWTGEPEAESPFAALARLSKTVGDG
jgi:uncharacterized metal-binding protein YceD (DUF177 family)